MTSHRPPLPAARGLRPLAVAVAITAALGLAACDPPVTNTAPLEDELMLCDASMCVISWRVVDSDDDGVADADELVAGTDPRSAESRPRPADLARLIASRGLPTFEFGRAALQVVPAEIQARREEARTISVDSAIPTGEGRVRGLAALGVDVEVLAEHGIDPARDGFTLGIGVGDGKGSEPPIRNTRFDVSLISADDAVAGERDVDTEGPLPLETEHGEVVEHIEYGDWSSTTYADGAQTICSDSAGCRTDPPGSPKYYTNPDADPAVFNPSKGDLDRVFRVRGAAIRTIQGWNQPGGGEVPDRGPSTIALIDPDVQPVPGLSGVVVVTDIPRITSAQPDVRPDLPSPLDAAGIGGPGVPGCQTICG